MSNFQYLKDSFEMFFSLRGERASLAVKPLIVKTDVGAQNSQGPPKPDDRRTAVTSTALDSSL